MGRREMVEKIWQQADAVCFDFDSTRIADFGLKKRGKIEKAVVKDFQMVTTEGIDELASYCGRSDEIKRLTNEAMHGQMDFRLALTKRLLILRPSLSLVERMVADLEKNPKLTVGVKELVDKLHSRRVDVFIVSGGFRRLIQPVANMLKISPDRIFANRLLFDETTGDYRGFDESEPTSSSGGKARVAQLLKEKFRYKNLVFIGDGITDCEASPPADGFIGFGGNVVRESVRTRAEWFVHDFQTLSQAL